MLLQPLSLYSALADEDAEDDVGNQGSDDGLHGCGVHTAEDHVSDAEQYDDDAQNENQAKEAPLDEMNRQEEAAAGRRNPSSRKRSAAGQGREKAQQRKSLAGEGIWS